MTAAPPAHVYVIDRVIDGDTIVVHGGLHVRLVQIDTPEVYFGKECYGSAASAITKRLLPPGTRVRLVRDPRLDDVDRYHRALRYVVRLDGLDINVHLVAIGAAAPYFYRGARGRFASLLLAVARQARAKREGLWGACPHTQLVPDRGVATGPPR